jgi:hypothetical protein
MSTNALGRGGFFSIRNGSICNPGCKSLALQRVANPLGAQAKRPVFLSRALSEPSELLQDLLDINAMNPRVKTCKS